MRPNPETDHHDTTIFRAVARCVQSWHCSQTDVEPPCSNDCSCWQSAEPIVAACERDTTQTTDSDMTAAADDLAVMDFTHAMMRKLARSRAKGRGGWQDCSNSDLWMMLREHVEKGDPVDVANLAMMIHQNAENGRG